jgi:hypothetical protein
MHGLYTAIGFGFFSLSTIVIEFGLIFEALMNHYKPITLIEQTMQ